MFSSIGARFVRRSSCQAHGRPRAKRIGRLPERRGSGSGARRAGYPGPPRDFCQTGSRGSGESKLPGWIAPGRRVLHLVAPMRKTFVFKQTCTHVQVCASVLFFWTVHGPFSFRQDRKENGGWNEPAIIMADAPYPSGHTPGHCHGPFRRGPWGGALGCTITMVQFLGQWAAFPQNL